MILKRFYDDRLAHASYLVGCPGAGAACIIDPNRDIDQYIEAAEAEGLAITAVTETHIHADLLSGSRELARATGATLYLSDEGDADWKYAFADEPNVKLVRDGDSIQVGAVRLDVLKTPGHTPEHISFLMTDVAVSPHPAAAFTGDFVFVGDVGRPDLLETAAGVKGTMEPGARSLFASLKRFGGYPDSLMIWPAHGAGSACGKSLGGVPVSSLGYEKVSNWAFMTGGEDAFVREVLSGQPEPPRYFAQMKRLNKLGPPLLGGFKTPPRVADGSKLLSPGDAFVIDLRMPETVAKSHIPGTFHIPLYKGFVTWAGWFAPYDKEIWLIADSEDDVTEAVRALALIGLDRVTAWFGHDAVAAYAKAGGTFTTFDQLPASELPPGYVLLDIRGRAEWEEEHIEGAVNIPLGLLPSRVGELPKGQPIAVHCQSGGRSPTGAALLLDLGFKDVVEVTDGYDGLVLQAKFREPVATKS